MFPVDNLHAIAVSEQGSPEEHIGIRAAYRRDSAIPRILGTESNSSRRFPYYEGGVGWRSVQRRRNSMIKRASKPGRKSVDYGRRKNVGFLEAQNLVANSSGCSKHGVRSWGFIDAVIDRIS